MSGFLTYLSAVCLVIGFMILIHEFGHYAAAKWLGVRVEVFSIGFGKRLLGFRRGDTDYRISALPLGGYVKMSGENPMDERSNDPGEFLNHPRWHRFIIAIAGPAMNILLAIGLLTFVYMVHYEYLTFMDQPTTLGWVEQDSPAAKLGLQMGDRITRIDDIQNPTWEQLEPKGMLSPNQPLSITVQRGNQSFDRTITPEATGSSQMGFAGWVPQQPNTVTEVDPDMPAARAGIKEGDEIVAVDGKPLPAIAALVESLKLTKDKPIEVTVLRQGQAIPFHMQPVITDVEGTTEKRYRIGIQNMPTKVGRLSFSQAISKSVEENEKTSGLILELMQKLVRRKVSIKTI